MSERLRDWIVGATLIAFAAFAGFGLFGPRVVIDARSDWASLSPDLRIAGRENALAGPKHLTLHIEGLQERDAVAIALASRPGLEPLEARVTRNGHGETRAPLTPKDITLRVPTGAGAAITLDVSASDDRPRPVYLFHLLGIDVRRGGWWPPLRSLFVPFAGLCVFVLRRRRAGIASATFWSLVAIAIAIGLLPDSLATLASDGRWRWLTATIVLAILVPAFTESTFRFSSRAALVLGALLFAGVMAHLPGLNGPSYWEWTWQRLDRVAVFGGLAMGFLPLFAARALSHGDRIGHRPLLALMAAGVSLSAFTAMLAQPGGLSRVHTVIEDSTVTSYYTDALELRSQSDWLASYPWRLPGLHQHSMTKPPGPVLFYAGLLHAFGPGPAAIWGCLLIALGAGLAVPAVFFLARDFGEATPSAFEAASVMALAPSLILFFPEFDQAFPLLTCALLVLWRRSLDGRLEPAIALGLVASLACFFSYSFLTLGLAGLSVAWGRPRSAMVAAIRAGVVMISAYLVLNVLTGFDPIATFRAAYANQARLSIGLGRSYLSALVHDPLDFAMGAGWIASLFALRSLARNFGSLTWDLLQRTAFVQVFGVAVSGLLRVEAARVWLFLVPLVAILAARELTRMSPRESAAVYLTMALLCAAVAQNMTFL